jgi:hypothetical protein
MVPAVRRCVGRTPVRLPRLAAAAVAATALCLATAPDAFALSSYVYTPSGTWTSNSSAWGNYSYLRYNQGDGELDQLGSIVQDGSCIGESPGSGWAKETCSPDHTSVVTDMWNESVYLIPAVWDQSGDSCGLCTYFIWGWEARHGDELSTRRINEAFGMRHSMAAWLGRRDSCRGRWFRRDRRGRVQ